MGLRVSIKLGSSSFCFLHSIMDSQSLTGRAGAGDVKISVVPKPETEPLAVAYELSPEQANFFKGETRIDDDGDLRSHILEVQEKAYKVRDHNVF